MMMMTLTGEMRLIGSPALSLAARHVVFVVLGEHRRCQPPGVEARVVVLCRGLGRLQLTKEL